MSKNNVLTKKRQRPVLSVAKSRSLGRRIRSTKRLVKKRARVWKLKKGKKVARAVQIKVQSEVAESERGSETAQTVTKELMSDSSKVQSERIKRKRGISDHKNDLKKKRKKCDQPGMQSDQSGGNDSTDTPTEQLVAMEMREWAELGVASPLLRALNELKFFKPTEIQKRTIPLVAKGNNDIIGAAETGSGKTLAFGIPILQHILSDNRSHGTNSDTTEHAQKLTSTGHVQKLTAAREKKSMDTCKSNEDKPLRGKHVKDDGKEENIIDMNEVLHRVERNRTTEASESEVEEEENEGSSNTTPEEEEKGDISEQRESDDLVENDELERDDESLASSNELDNDSVEGGGLLEDVSSVGLREKGIGLVGFKDDIPDEEFERMIAGELDPWESHDETAVVSHDDNKVQCNDDNKRSHDIKRKSRDSLQDQREISHDSVRKLIALILAPTRELAIQVHDHLTAVAKHTNIKVCAVVGGMAMEKQERLLSQQPPIVVATPGRLWSLMNEGNSHLNSLAHLKFLVLDEADRMIEFGHFRELRNILDRVNGAQVTGSSPGRRTMVFSATLTVGRRTTERKKKKKTTSSQESIENLMEHVKLKEDAHLVDLTRSKVTVETLTETKITCTTEEKDFYIYYFLLLYPGRTLIFVNSIDCLQRLRALLEVLQLKPLPLHAHMQQRQRLKNLDRFTSSETGVLVASDVAARGLDLPQVQHVIHYQVPRNTELYVHRSGRTARAQREGLSVMLVGPEDLKSYRNICKSLNKDEELPSFPVDSAYLKAIRRRVSLARQIHKIEHQRNKSVRAEQWLSKSAKALDIELDEDLLEKHPHKAGKRNERPLRGEDDSKIHQLRADLDQLLRTPILPRTVSMTFPTRDQSHRDILLKLQASRGDKTNQIVVSETRDALSVARTR